MARGTLPVQLKLVCGDVEFMLACDFFLQFFDITILELDDFSTLCAYHMVVMSLMGDVVVVCLGSKMSLLCQSTFAKQIECAVDGCQADMRFQLRQLMIDLLGGNMFRLQKSLENNLALAGDPKLVIGEMFPQDSHLVAYGLFCRATRH